MVNELTGERKHLYRSACEAISMPTFGSRLKLAMKHARKTRVQVAAAVGMTRQTIGMLVNDKVKSMTAENAAEAANFLGVSYYWLCTGKGRMIEPIPLAKHQLPFRRIRAEDLERLRAAGKLAEAESFMLGLLSVAEAGDSTKSQAN